MRAGAKVPLLRAPEYSGYPGTGRSGAEVPKRAPTPYSQRGSSPSPVRMVSSAPTASSRVSTRTTSSSP